MIEFSAEDTGETIEGYIKRPDKFRISFFDNITPSSLGRLERFAKNMSKRGHTVYGGRSHNNLRIAVFLQERSKA